MTRRLALVLVPPGGVVGEPPPGIDPTRWSRALIEDSYEVLADLARTGSGFVGTAADLAALDELSWPDTVLVELPRGQAGSGDDGADPVAGAVEAVEPVGAVEAVGAVGAVEAVGDRADVVVLLSPDAPDLPGLHVGKVFQALEQADLAWVPVADGGVAVLGFALPLADWVRRARPGFDGTPLDWLAAAPDRHRAVAAPGWHRLRHPGDLRHLDPGLSGWETTRALLSGSPLS